MKLLRLYIEKYTTFVTFAKYCYCCDIFSEKQPTVILFALVCACLILEFQTFNANIRNLDGFFILTVVDCDITRHVDFTGFQYQYLKKNQTEIPDKRYVTLYLRVRSQIAPPGLMIRVGQGGH